MPLSQYLILRIREQKHEAAFQVIRLPHILEVAAGLSRVGEQAMIENKEGWEMVSLDQLCI